MLSALQSKRKLQSEDGWTLLEMLITVIIISILTVIALHYFKGREDTINIVQLEASINAAVYSTTGELSDNIYATKEEISPPLLGKNTQWDLHRILRDDFCINVWDASAEGGVGSISNPLFFESFTGGCASVGVYGTRFGPA